MSLNSCNVLIPQIEGLNIKYVLAVLNSSVSTFFISKRYNSIKILRTYIEQLPIPKATLDEQNVIIGLVDKIMAADNKNIIDNLYKQIDEKIFDLYSLNQQQRNVIRQSV